MKRYYYLFTRRKFTRRAKKRPGERKTILRGFPPIFNLYSSLRIAGFNRGRVSRKTRVKMSENFGVYLPKPNKIDLSLGEKK